MGVGCTVLSALKLYLCASLSKVLQRGRCLKLSSDELLVALPTNAERLENLFELELELIIIQSQMAQKPMLLVEVGARALRVRLAPGG